MASVDPGLGIDVPDFDGEGFRAAIQFAMQMGAPPDPERRPKFIRKGSGRTYWKDGVQLGAAPRMGREGEPLDPDIEVRTTPDQEIEVDCAIEIERAEAEELPVGTMRPTKVVATLLDAQYALVEDCRELLYNGDRYVYGYEPEANGLFDVGVHTMIFYAKDES